MAQFTINKILGGNAMYEMYHNQLNIYVRNNQGTIRIQNQHACTSFIIYGYDYVNTATESSGSANLYFGSIMTWNDNRWGGFSCDRLGN